MPTALIFGASGISGWGLLKYCLTDPTPDYWTRIIGLTNRPMTLEAAALPNDPRYQLAHGIDLLAGADAVTEKLKGVEGIEEVETVFFCAYISNSDYHELSRINVALLRAATIAVDTLCPNLKSITLQSGSKYYGTEFAAQTPVSPPPLVETMPRVPSPFSEKIFYYHQYDLLKELSTGKNWTFYDIRPDVVVGFVPQGNCMNLAGTLGMFLSLYRYVEGEGAEVVFPGTEKSWSNTHTDTSQDVLSRFEILVATSEKAEPQGSYNIADGDKTTWAEKWPLICSWFGLKGVAPPQGAKDTQSKAFREWWDQNRERYQEMKKEFGLKEQEPNDEAWGFQEMIMCGFEVDREYGLEKAASVGWTEKRGHEHGYWMAFEMMRAAGFVPKF
ncbi:hypothetical protein FPQ18DRAFT_67221 [Pyronema domesticum]|uniref:Similar to Uncharacterized protein C757.02c acc. no. O74913 n=1 Tax=Pyronema omphalodes (strain CBS 100304) TaxID=1076935 RepID=U4LN27_PYROM|nr:hypothetical protein FPQ18DRAFT_67221 [Pyronema domesticum]CCX15730.1 Similar to Uncharacterized protein C757.02c; acc. no. O74913 [Pyronema omphalodes CBS 100304]